MSEWQLLGNTFVLYVSLFSVTTSVTQYYFITIIIIAIIIIIIIRFTFTNSNYNPFK